MKKFTVIIIAIMLLMSVNPVAAANQPPPPVGERIDLLDGDQTYPADTAFYIAHYFYLGTGVRIPTLADLISNSQSTVSSSTRTLSIMLL